MQFFSESVTSISALRDGKIDSSSIEIIHALQRCSLESKAANLRALLNTEVAEKLLQMEGDLILQWVTHKSTGWQFNQENLFCFVTLFGNNLTGLS